MSNIKTVFLTLIALLGCSQMATGYKQRYDIDFHDQTVGYVQDVGIHDNMLEFKVGMDSSWIEFMITML